MSRKRRKGGHGSPPSFENVWTKREIAIVREQYGKVDAHKIAKQLKRTTSGVMHKAQRLGLTSRRRWTKADDATLAAMWGESDLLAIARVLKRTPVTVYWRADKIGLERGCPEGFEYLRNAAKRTGYDAKTLRGILEAAGVRIGRSMARPTKKRAAYRARIVDVFEVDRAVAEWTQSAPLNVYAEEAGLDLQTLQRWLKLAARHTRIRIPPPPTERKHRWRVPSGVVAAVLAWRATLESISAGSVRVGVQRVTMTARLQKAGVVPILVGRTQFVPRSDMDRLSRIRLDKIP